MTYLLIHSIGFINSSIPQNCSVLFTKNKKLGGMENFPSNGDQLYVHYITMASFILSCYEFIKNYLPLVELMQC